jgi:hypothetical protein
LFNTMRMAELGGIAGRLGGGDEAVHVPVRFANGYLTCLIALRCRPALARKNGMLAFAMMGLRNRHLVSFSFM